MLLTCCRLSFFNHEFIVESQNIWQALNKTKANALTRQAYFATLNQNGLNAGERGYEALTESSKGSLDASILTEGISQGIGMGPDLKFGAAGTMGTPLTVSEFPLGSKLASVFSTQARLMGIQAQLTGTNASLNLTQGGQTRRSDEWVHQNGVIGIEIEQIQLHSQWIASLLSDRLIVETLNFLFQILISLILFCCCNSPSIIVQF